MSQTVIVIGGGVIGLSTAYHLAKRNAGKVVLLEAGSLGDGSSSRAAGIITSLLTSRTAVLARQKALTLYRELSEELSGYRFHDVGCLNLLDAESAARNLRMLPLYVELESRFEVLDAAEIRRRWPALHPPENLTGLFDPLGGYSEPDEYIPALAARCLGLGVDIREHHRVTDFKIHNGRVSGVVTNHGLIEADATICTVHSWILHVLAPLNLRLPLKTFVHQRYTTRPLAEPLRAPAVNANPYSGYLRPALGGRLLAGIETTGREEFRVPSLDFSMSAVAAPPEAPEQLKKKLTPLVPVLATTDWETERVGLLAFSADGDPILGPVNEFPGLYVGAAFHSGGFAYNPVAGMLLAETVVAGTTSIDIAEFSPNRFRRDETDQYLATTATQSQMVARRH